MAIIDYLQQDINELVNDYIKHGWSLVPIPPNTKGPRDHDWQLKENALTLDALPMGYGVGLAHAYSGTMALDIDSYDTADMLLGFSGINLQKLFDTPDSVAITSGRPGSAKLLYAMPEGLILPTRKVVLDHKMVYELRCGTTNNTTAQDVLPPSIHPDTQQPYQWAGNGDWHHLPTIPESLYAHWKTLIDKDLIIPINNTNDSNPDVDLKDISWDTIERIIKYIDPDTTRDEWISVGMAIHYAATHWHDYEYGINLWDQWSSQSVTKYPGQKQIINQWNSFKTNKTNIVKLGTLFHIAQKYGYVIEHKISKTDKEIEDLFPILTPPENPTDVLSYLRPTPPDIDLSLWPSLLATRAQEVSDQVGCDPLVPLFAGLSAVCAVADATSRLELMEGYKVPPILWLMTVGDPGDKKSPGSRPMLAPLKIIEGEHYDQFKRDLLLWEGKEAAYASAKKAFLTFAASPENLLGAEAPFVPDLPPQPVPTRLTVSDITSQKLVRYASERPRGLLCYLDEMNSWSKKLTDRSSGEDRSAWVVSYEAEPYDMDRVGAGAIHCDNLAIAIFGNMQPQVFKSSFASLCSDGLLQRFIPAILRHNQTRLSNPSPNYLTHYAKWEQLLRTIFDLPSMVYRLSPMAYTLFREFQSWYEDTKKSERLVSASVEYMQAFGKLEGTAGRLIFVFHLIESPYDSIVSADIVKRVISIIKGYVIPSFRYALSEVGGITENSLEIWMIEHIIHISEDVKTIDMRSLKRSARRRIEGMSTWLADQRMQDAMVPLEEAGWVTQIDNKLTKHHVVWAINPNIPKMFKDYRTQVLKAKQKHVDMIYELGAKSPKWKGRKIVPGYDPETMDE